VWQSNVLSLATMVLPPQAGLEELE